MMRRFSMIIVLAGVTLTGCVTSGSFHAANLTEVQLSQPNFRVVATNVQGRSSAGYLIGLSTSIYGQMQTLALVRISGNEALYGEAVTDLWANVRQQLGSVEGRELALVNVRFDADALNLLVYTRPTVIVRADVVEFTTD